MLECRPKPSGHVIIQEPVERQPDNPAEVLAGRRSELLTWRDPREEESGELLVWRVELRREYVLDAYQILEAPAFLRMRSMLKASRLSALSSDTVVSRRSSKSTERNGRLSILLGASRSV